VNEPQRLIDRLRGAAADQGFVSCGLTPAIESTGFTDLMRWIESGYDGEMSYFADRQEAYRHPRKVLEGVRSIIALAFPYAAAAGESAADGQGRIARYAWSGDDYHDVIHPKLKSICRLITEASPGARARGVVDTAPLMEREIAELAGLGWRGKNTLLLNKRLGSYFFLACVLTDVELPYDSPHRSSHCGTCTACLDACPTDAFPEAGVLDATRCISYLTIEHRGPIPAELREGIGDWLFGCDVCQDVCPWNRKPSRNGVQPADSLDKLELAGLFRISEEEFRVRFRKTPLWRTRRRGILRNAAIVLGNQRDPSSLEALTVGLSDDEPLVRGASAWALGRIGGEGVSEVLNGRAAVETDPDVCAEIDSALEYRV
jgi:epoxyqueuosine reductase